MENKQIVVETFAKPAVAGIIQKKENGKTYLLLQTRMKENGGNENGMIEIPAGKVRTYENIFDALRREVWEETGLHITLIREEIGIVIDETNGYKTSTCEPFLVTQNLSGGYSLIVLTFLCEAEGDLLTKTNETTNIHWEEVNEVKRMLENNTEQFFPMHINALRKYLKEYHN